MSLDKKLSELPLASEVESTDEVYLISNGESKRARVSSLPIVVADFTEAAGAAAASEEAAAASAADSEEAAAASAAEASASAASAVDSANAVADVEQRANDYTDAQLTSFAAGAAGVFDDAASGIAGTSEGDYFNVPSPVDKEIYIIYRHDAGPVATEIGRTPSSALFDVSVENERKDGLLFLLDSSGDTFAKTEQDIFVLPETPIGTNNDAALLYEAITDVEFRFGQLPRINNVTGELRRVYFNRISSSVASGTIQVSIERYDEDGVFDTYSLFQEGGDPTYLNNEVLYHERLILPERIFVRVESRPQKIGTQRAVNNNLDATKGQIQPAWLQKGLDAGVSNQTHSLYDYEINDVRLVTNFNYTPPVSKAENVSKEVSEGLRTYKLDGAGDDHAQACLTHNSPALTLSGMKNLTVFASASGQSANPQPPVSSIREPSGARRPDSKILGETLGQHIHPDIDYVTTGDIGGYKYWMVNSIYPYGIPAYEDAELFVSNDGVSWERIHAANETLQTDVGLTLPPTHWDVPTERQNLFMPIPDTGAMMEFSTNAGEATREVTGFLNHDPAIHYDNGYIHIYVTYNFALDGSGTKKYRYVVCYRTNNGTDWEYVREDGTAVSYDATTAQLIFTKTGGVRNHVRYTEQETDIDASPQIIKVSPTEWYWYAQNVSFDPVSGNKFGLVRYAGTSPYEFDFNSREITTLDVVPTERVWHTGVRFYDGVYYAVYGGVMAKSANGIDFTQAASPFFWRGMQSDLYKPTFVKGGDGKIKFAMSLQVYMAYPAGFMNENYATKFENNRVVTQTILCEYDSFAQIDAMGAAINNTAYVDLMLALSNEYNNNTRLYFYPGISTQTTLPEIEFCVGDVLHTKVFLNSRGSSDISFSGIIIDGRGVS